MSDRKKLSKNVRSFITLRFRQGLSPLKKITALNFLEKKKYDEASEASIF